MADRPQDAPRHAGRVVRRVLLRRNIAVDPVSETRKLHVVGSPLNPGPGGCSCLFLHRITPHVAGLQASSVSFGRSSQHESPPTA